MDEKEWRELQGNKTIIGRGQSELGVLESPMEHDGHLLPNQQLEYPYPWKKIEKEWKNSKAQNCLKNEDRWKKIVKVQISGNPMDKSQV